MTEIRPKPKIQSQVFFIGILALLFGLTWMIFKPFVIYMAVGVLIAVLAYRIDKIWEKILPNRIAAFGTLATIAIIIMAPFVGVGFLLAKDAKALTAAIQDGSFEARLNEVVTQLTPWMSEEERTQAFADAWASAQPVLEKFLQDTLVGFVAALPNVLIAFTVILFVVYYVLVDGERLVRWLRRAAPLPPAQVDFLMKEAYGGVQAVFFGQILTSLIQGALGGIGFWIVGLPSPVLWGAVMAVLSLLPVIGTPVVWVPAVGILLAQGEYTQAIILLAYSAIVVMQSDNFLRPLLIGSRADIHPIFVLVGVLGGVAAFGFIGLFLGPLLVGITVSILKVWESDYLDPELIPEEILEDKPKKKGRKKAKADSTEFRTQP